MRKRTVHLVVLTSITLVTSALAWWMSTTQDKSVPPMRLFTFTNTQDIVSLQLQRAEDLFVVDRLKDNDWQLQTPLVGPADTETVNIFLGTLLQSTLQPLDPDTETSTLELSAPRVALTLQNKHGRKETLQVGRHNTFNDTYFVRILPQNTIGLVNAALRFQLDIKLHNLRDKRLWRFEPQNVRKLQVIPNKPKNASAIRYTLSRRHENDDFHIQDTQMNADPQIVSNILTWLQNIHVRQFIDRADADDALKKAFAQPDLTVHLTLADSSVQTVYWVTLLESHADKPRVFASHNDTGQFFSLGNVDLQKNLLLDMETLRDHRLMVFERSQVFRIDLFDGAELSLTLQRTSAADGLQGWLITFPIPGAAKSSEVFALLYRLWNLRALALDIIPEKRERAHALDFMPQHRIKIFDEQSVLLAELTIGKPSHDGGFVFVRSNSGLHTLSESVLKGLDFDVEHYVEHDDEAL
ncbi:MAG: DUF4340 domain-containing protein [Myxococcota bacterium]